MKNCVKLFALQKVLIKFIKGLVACECKQPTDLNYSLFIIHYTLFIRRAKPWQPAKIFLSLFSASHLKFCLQILPTTFSNYLRYNLIFKLNVL